MKYSARLGSTRHEVEIHWPLQTTQRALPPHSSQSAKCILVVYVGLRPASRPGTTVPSPQRLEFLQSEAILLPPQVGLDRDEVIQADDAAGASKDLQRHGPRRHLRVGAYRRNL